MKKTLLTGLATGLLVLCMVGMAGGSTIITSFQTGEVFDGQKGAKDGIGDAMYNNISSYFGPGYSSIVWEGQAMAYFDLTPVAGQYFTSALFEWSVNFSQGDGAPSVTGIYGMENNAGLSLDDYNSGSLWGTISTAAYSSGDIIALDITNYLNSFDGVELGVYLSSLDTMGNTFMNMNDLSATITFNIGTAPTIPEPTTMVLFGFGLLGMAGLTRRQV